MVRIGFSFVGSLILFYIQSLIVMKWFHYQTIRFESALQVAIVCIVNFFLVFSIVTQVTPWFIKLKMIETEIEE
jgi:hypothetical protein